MNQRWLWSGLIAVLLLSAAVRLHGSADMPLWTDEGWTVWAIHEHQPATILNNLEDERHPPLYFLTLSAWWSLLGPDRLILRLVSIAAGVLTTSTVIRIARDWLDNESAIAAGLLFAVLDSAIYYTRELRPYSWMILAGTLTSLFFLRYLHSSQRRWIVYYTLSAIFTLYVGYFGVLLLALQGIFFIRAANWDQRRHLLVAWGVALIIFLPWLPSMIRQFDLILADGGIRDYPGSFNTTLDDSIAVLRLLFNEQFTVMVALYAVGMAAMYRNRTQRIAHYLVGASMGILLFMMLVNLQIGVVSARTLSLLLPFFVIVIAGGLRTFPVWIRRPGVVLLAFSFLLLPQDVQPRLDSINAVEALADNVMPGDLVILETGADDNVFWYEIRLLDRDIEIIRTVPWVRVRALRSGPQPVVPHIEQQIAQADRIWVVHWLQAKQVLPYLYYGTDYRWILNSEHSVGETYEGRFRDDTIQLSMFEKPPLFDSPLKFGDEFQLSGALVPDRFEAGETMHLDLWWTALNPSDGTYSVIYTLRGQNGKYELDDRFLPGFMPHKSWIEGQTYIGRHSIEIPPDVVPGRYRMRMYIFSEEAQQYLQVEDKYFGNIGTIVIE